MANSDLALAFRQDVAKAQRDRALDAEAEALFQAKCLAHKLLAANQEITRLKAENVELRAQLAESGRSSPRRSRRPPLSPRKPDVY